MTLSKYDKEFAQAMKVKLKLNRQMRSKAGEESVDGNAPSAPLDGLTEMRNGIAEATIAENPGLTKEEVLRGMKEMGF
jgi:hypothetical protein|tara:strand:+ start:727 stop:960 length:234 start_codon:yes stop_codon:yes gene_type:complete